MSTTIPTTVALAVAVDTSAATSPSPTPSLRRHHYSLSSSFSTLRLSSQCTQQSIRTGTVVAAAQRNNASLDGASTRAASNRESSAQEIKNDTPSSESGAVQASEESLSEFIAQVSSLVKLVDSRDIMELHMKQTDCEILIRKKEAVIQAPPPPTFMMGPPPPQMAATPYVSAPAPAPSASSVPAPSVPKPATSSIPPMKSPMAGTFYRSPAPGAPPFVKVGDKVQKGQVLCIIEAMKLMNEIEADQSGTIVEVIAGDGKPVSLDSPLFAIQP
ncbi:hypothetical protein vseg_018843 [Gypsophila vaccaria]